MIIWLASYPKSGNTLVRSLLSSYFFSKDGKFEFNQLNNIKTFPSNGFFEALGININDENEIYKNYINAQKLINHGKKNKIVFLKTHSSFCKLNGYDFTDAKNTIGAIYIVRDPRNIVTSYSNHFNKTKEESVNNILGDMFLMEDNTRCRTHIGKWNFHYNSWKNFNSNRIIFVKYEDLIKDTEKSLRKIIKFCGLLTRSRFFIDESKLKNVVKTTSFHELKKKEKETGFFEASKDKKTGAIKPFFNLGQKNNWKKMLSENDQKKITKIYKKELLELGYL